VHQRQGGHLSLAPAPEDGVTGPGGDGAAAEHDATAARPAALHPVELPPEHRPTASNLTLLAAVAGVAALLLAAVAIAWPGGGSSTAPTAEAPALEQAVALLAAPSSDRIAFANSVGRLVLLVGATGDAMLVLNGLSPAPEGKTYQAWVKPPGPGEARSAGLFSGNEQFVTLASRVPRGAQVGVTLEDAAGATTPSRAPRLQAVRPPAAPAS